MSITFADETSVRMFERDFYEDYTDCPTKVDDGPNALSFLMGQIMVTFTYGVITDSRSLRIYYSDNVLNILFDPISKEIDDLILKFSAEDCKAVCMYYKQFRFQKTDTIIEDLEKLKEIFRLAKLDIYLENIRK